MSAVQFTPLLKEGRGGEEEPMEVERGDFVAAEPTLSTSVEAPLSQRKLREKLVAVSAAIAMPSTSTPALTITKKASAADFVWKKGFLSGGIGSNEKK